MWGRTESWCDQSDVRSPRFIAGFFVVPKNDLSLFLTMFVKVIESTMIGSVRE